MSHVFCKAALGMLVAAVGSALSLALVGYAAFESRRQPGLITELPFVITKPGDYQLAGPLQTSQDGIIIEADHVTIDGCGYALSYVGGSETTRNGIQSASGHSDITVKNIVVNGFFQNLVFNEDYGKLAADDPTAASDIEIANVTSVNAKFRGLRLDARRSVVRDSVFLSTGGSTFTDDAYCMAIEVYGPHNRIEGNTVRDVRGVDRGEGVGISISDFGVDTEVVGNSLGNSSPDDRADFGIWVGGNSQGIFLNNQVARFQSGIVFCPDTVAMCADNRVADCDLPVSTGSAVVWLWPTAGAKFELSPWHHCASMASHRDYGWHRPWSWGHRSRWPWPTRRPEAADEKSLW